MIEKLTIVCTKYELHNLSIINIYNPYYTHVHPNIFSYINE
jgi:hypothetical protein